MKADDVVEEYTIYKNGKPQKVKMTYGEFRKNVLGKMPRLWEFTEDDYNTFNANSPMPLVYPLEHYRNEK